MGNARVSSRAQLGLAAPLVSVEVHLGAGLPVFSIVGLPEKVVKESKDRVRAALVNSQFEFPSGRITVNLSPADLPKEGCRYDLPIALGILLASSQLRFPDELLANSEFYGELGLAGELKPIKGVLLAAAHAMREARRVVVPSSNLAEARLVAPDTTRAASTLLGVCSMLKSRKSGVSPDAEAADETAPVTTSFLATVSPTLDLSDVRGQAAPKRALMIAAAGGHSILKLCT